MDEPNKAALREIAAAFQIDGNFVAAERCGSGHINDTFVASHDHGGCIKRHILQRINHGIFRNVPLLMNNVLRVTEYYDAELAREGVTHRDRRSLKVVSTRDGASYLQTTSGEYWRSYPYIEETHTCDRIESTEQAFEAARAFGRFLAVLSGIPIDSLGETIPNFHDTPSRFAALQKAVSEDSCGRVKDVREEIEFFRKREGDMDRLMKKIAAGELPLRVTHNDCKLNNVLLDDKTGEGICVVDLDIVMPGVSLYDFGDMVRTATSPADEDEPDLTKVQFQMPMFEALVRGYLAGTAGMLTREEIACMAFSGKLITMEIGIRFLTDHLQGDIYFRTHRPGHNLDRCRTQITLAREIEQHLPAMEAFVKQAAGTV